MSKIGIVRLILNLNGKPVMADEILRKFPQRGWKVIKAEIEDLVRCKELKSLKLRGKVHYCLGGDKKIFEK